MKTMLLPTTVGVNEQISMQEALSILMDNGIYFEVAGDVVSGMYLADSGYIVEEELLPIMTDISAEELATMFTQECILESDGITAQLVSQDGDVWAHFTDKVEYVVDNEEEIKSLQTELARFFGGASRVGNRVWAWGTQEKVNAWAV